MKGAVWLVLGLLPYSSAFVPSALPRTCAHHTMRMQAEGESVPKALGIPRKLLSYAAMGFVAWQSGFGYMGGYVFPEGRSAQVAHAAKPSNAPTSAGSRVNKDAESLLRWGLPIDNREARELQEAIETLKDDIRIKRFGPAVQDARKAKQIAMMKKDALISAVRSEGKGEAGTMLTTIADKMDDVAQVFSASAGRGSEQERDKLDQAYRLQKEASRALSRLEEMMVPAEYKVEVPSEYSNLPQLQGRASVEMVIKRPSGEKFDIKGKLYDQIKLTMVVDGYNAPLTGGNFVDLVTKGFYDGLPITRSDGFVVQYGDPQPNGDVHGYVPSGAKEVRKIPLEIFVKNDDAPMYGVTTEDDGRGYAATRLPFQAYGTLGMAREEYVADSASSQIFMLLFESDLTPAGKNLLDGRYACLGYTIDNAELLAGVREGDVIASAKVVSGLEHLKKS